MSNASHEKVDCGQVEDASRGSLKKRVDMPSQPTESHRAVAPFAPEVRSTL